MAKSYRPENIRRQPQVIAIAAVKTKTGHLEIQAAALLGLYFLLQWAIF